MATMFDSIAHRYDRINSTASFGLDGYWRNRLIAKLKKTEPATVLDLACGTGVLSWKIFRKLKTQVVGLDLSPNMLQKAKKKCKDGEQSPLFLEGEAERLPFEACRFDAITIAFGIRNFQDRTIALSEAFRVLTSGGSLHILEFATPRNPIWKFLFTLYFFHIMPLWGRVLSGNKTAYRYLSQSVPLFPQYDALCKEMADAGFSNPHYHALTGGVTVLYSGTRKQA